MNALRSALTTIDNEPFITCDALRRTTCDETGRLQTADGPMVRWSDGYGVVLMRGRVVSDVLC